MSENTESLTFKNRSQWLTLVSGWCYHLTGFQIGGFVGTNKSIQMGDVDELWASGAHPQDAAHRICRVSLAPTPDDLNQWIAEGVLV